MSTCSPLTSWYSSTSTCAKPPGDPRSRDRVREQRAPVQQQVVEVEHAERALARRVGSERLAQLLGVLGAPREVACEHLRERGLGVHHARVDVEHRVCARESPAALGVPALLADQVDQVGRVARVEHAEARAQAQRGGVQAHQPVRDRVERAAHDAPARGRLALRERARALDQLARRPAREAEQQDALRGHALPQQPGHARAQRRGLAGARARQHEQRAARIARRLALTVVQPRQVRRQLLEGGGEHVFAKLRQLPDGVRARVQAQPGRVRRS